MRRLVTYNCQAMAAGLAGVASTLARLRPDLRLVLIEAMKANAKHAEIDAALRHLQSTGLQIPDVGKKHFPLKRFARTLRLLQTEIENGLGIMLIRGLPRDRYSAEEMGLIYWGIGAHLGRAGGLAHRRGPAGIDVGRGAGRGGTGRSAAPGRAAADPRSPAVRTGPRGQRRDPRVHRSDETARARGPV